MSSGRKRPSPLLNVSSVEKWADFKEFKRLRTKSSTASITPTTATTPSAAVKGSICQIFNFTSVTPSSSSYSWLFSGTTPLTATLRPKMDYLIDASIAEGNVLSDKEYLQLYKKHVLNESGDDSNDAENTENTDITGNGDVGTNTADSNGDIANIGNDMDNQAQKNSASSATQSQSLLDENDQQLFPGHLPAHTTPQDLHNDHHHDSHQTTDCMSHDTSKLDPDIDPFLVNGSSEVSSSSSSTSMANDQLNSINNNVCSHTGHDSWNHFNYLPRRTAATSRSASAPAAMLMMVSNIIKDKHKFEGKRRSLSHSPPSTTTNTFASSSSLMDEYMHNHSQHLHPAQNPLYNQQQAFQCQEIPLAPEKDQEIFNGPSSVTIRFNPLKTGALKYDVETRQLVVQQDFLIDGRKITIIIDEEMTESIKVSKNLKDSYSESDATEIGTITESTPCTSVSSVGSNESNTSPFSTLSMDSVSTDSYDASRSPENVDVSVNAKSKQYTDDTKHSSATKKDYLLKSTSNEYHNGNTPAEFNPKPDPPQNDIRLMAAESSETKADTAMLEAIKRSLEGNSQIREIQMKQMTATVENEAKYIQHSTYQSMVARIMANGEMYEQCIQGKKGAYSCSHCTLKFPNLLEFSRHLDAYHIIRPYLCKHKSCPWSIIGFSRKNQWKRHAECQHTMGHQCPFEHCGKSFPRRDGLRRHLNRVHNLDVSGLMKNST